jgi:hypothetical protein
LVFQRGGCAFPVRVGSLSVPMSTKDVHTTSSASVVTS